MSNENGLLVCPLCGTRADVFENKVSSVTCPNCGKYTYPLSVHPFLNEPRFRNQTVLDTLSEMAVSAYKSGNVLQIDLEMIQKLEKNLIHHI